MNGVIFLFIIALIWIIFASLQDLKSREVADWLSFSLIIFALGFRFFYSLFARGNFMFFYQGLIGLGIFLVLGNLFYYARLFAGGDAKLMIALGVILPFSESFLINLKIFVWFFILFLPVGAIYGLSWTIFLAVKNFKNFKKEFFRRLRENKKVFYLVMLIGLVLMAMGFFETLLFISGALIFVFPYFFLFAKAVEEVCMIKDIPVNDLTEGDWLYKNVKVGRKVIKAKWDGLSNKEIREIKKKHKKVRIRQGIPFVPVFLISFVILFYIWEKGLWNSFF